MEVKKINGYPENTTKCCECSEMAQIKIVTKSREMCLCEKHARTLRAKMFYLMGGKKNEKHSV